MNLNFNEVTLSELFNDLFTPVGYKDLAPKYCSLLLHSGTDFSQEAGGNCDPNLIDSAADEVAKLIRQAFGIFRLITARPAEKYQRLDLITTQTALHEYMLKTLYHVNRNCRALLEAQVDYAKYDSIESYLRVLKRKHGISDKRMLLALQQWHEPDEAIFYKLVEREAKLKVFDMGSGEVCFQIYNEQGKEILQVLDEMSTNNGLVISKRYFFFRIFQVFQHLHLCTQLCELERTGAITPDGIEIKEVGTELMDAFNQAAKECL